MPTHPRPAAVRRLTRLVLAALLPVLVVPVIVLGSAPSAQAVDCMRRNQGAYNEDLYCQYIGNYFSSARLTEGTSVAAMYPNPAIEVTAQLTDLTPKDGKCTWIEIKGAGVRHEVSNSRVCKGNSRWINIYVGHAYTLKGERPKLFHCIETNCTNFFTHFHGADGRWHNGALSN